MEHETLVRENPVGTVLVTMVDAAWKIGLDYRK